MDFALIPARGGSKGVPRKNLRLLAGVPLIAHSIRTALEVFDQVFVSTEDAEVGEVARAHGALVIERPNELARDETPMAPVIEHAVSWCEVTYGSPGQIFLLEPTSPLRAAADIRTAESILRGDDCDSVMAVSEAADPLEWALHPTADGLLTPACGLDGYLARRQDLKPAYFPGPMMAIETGAFRHYKRLLTDRTRFFVVPEQRALDIDTEADFRLAELLMSAPQADL